MKRTAAFPLDIRRSSLLRTILLTARKVNGLADFRTAVIAPALERQFQPELNDPGVSGGCDPPEVGVTQRFGRRIEVGVVDRVEKLRAELQLPFLIVEG